MQQPASVLSDGTIRRLVDAGEIVISPWDPLMVQPASVDLKLGTSFRVFHNHKIQVIDLADPPKGLTEPVEVEPDDLFVIHPNEFVLGRTEERVEMPANLETTWLVGPGRTVRFDEVAIQNDAAHRKHLVAADLHVSDRLQRGIIWLETFGRKIWIDGTKRCGGCRQISMGF